MDGNYAAGRIRGGLGGGVWNNRVDHSRCIRDGGTHDHRAAHFAQTVADHGYGVIPRCERMELKFSGSIHVGGLDVRSFDAEEVHAQGLTPARIGDLAVKFEVRGGEDYRRAEQRKKRPKHPNRLQLIPVISSTGTPETKAVR